MQRQRNRPLTLQQPDPGFGVWNQETLCAVARQLAMRMDKLIAILQRGPEEEEEGVLFPGTPAAPHTPIGRLVELMKLAQASYPRDHQNRTVTTSATFLASNAGGQTVPIMVTNQDTAQLLWYGASIINTENAPVIQPTQSLKINLSPSSDLYGIVTGPASISVGVSSLDLPFV